MKRTISRNYRQMNNGHLVTFGGHVSASLTGNANFPSPIPTLTVYDAVLLDYANACINFQKGNIETAAVRDEKRRILIENLDLLANYVELTAEFKETILVTSGFDLKKDRPTRRPIPSTPAISIAENARYGLADGSGQRNSIRFAFGESEYIGMRMQAERLRCE